MNHCYRLVWSHLHNAWVAVTETARAHGKSKSSTVRRMAVLASVATLTSLASPAFSASPVAPAANALPTGGVVAAGSATIASAGNVMNIAQASQRAVLNWQSFDIGRNATVNFNQPNSSAVALNRITGNNASQIYGKLNANGHVFLMNPSGTYFAPGSQVNVGGLVASTLQMNDSDFMAGNDKLSNPGGGLIEALGTINAGSVALVGNNIANRGNIVATTVSLVSGNQVAIDLTGNNLIRARITDPSLSARISNSGNIQAATVTLTAGQAKDAINSIVNNTGTIRATTLTQKGGEVFLEANTVSNSGLIDASGAHGGGSVKLMGDMDSGRVNVGGTLKAEATQSGNGGFIETSAAHVKVADDFKVSTLAANGKTGTWLIDPFDFTIGVGGDMTGALVQNVLATGNFSIQSSGGVYASGNGDINIYDTFTWNNHTLTLTAARDININAPISATGTSSLVMNTATTNGADTAVAGGAVRVGMNGGGFTGRVDFTSTGLLTINGNNYTVINSLGAQGSGTGFDLQGLSAAGYYALGANIDATPTSGWAAGLGFNPLIFSGGAINGLGHVVSNLFINRPATDQVGLIGTLTTSTTTISNIGLTASNITGQFYVGGLIGQMNEGNVFNTFSAGAVTATAGGGGLIGTLWNGGVVSHSYAAGAVIATGGGNSYSGGLVGLMANGAVTPEIYDSFSSAAVTGTDRVGGLVGNVQKGNIYRSYATGNVIGGNVVGGLVGASGQGAPSSAGSIVDSYATGTVTGADSVGGLVGVNAQYSSITSSYSTGSVIGSSNVGGLVGFGIGNVTGSFWDSTSSGVGSSAGGTGLPTASMQTSTDFTNAGWNTTIWNLGGGAYPVLKWTVPATPPACIYNVCWTGGGGDFNWFNVANWSTNALPALNQTVYIDAAGSPTIVYNGAGGATLASLTSNENLQLFNAGATLTVTGVTNFGTGTLFDLNNGIATFNGPTNFYNLALSSASGTLMGTGAINVSNGFSQTGGIINRTGDMHIVQMAGNVAFDAASVGNVSVDSKASNVTLGNINATGAVIIKAEHNITLTNTSTIASNGGNVVLNSDEDGIGQGGIVLNTGSSIATGGGYLVMGGGATPSTGYAVGTAGSNNNGIYISGATLNAAGGNIVMHATGMAGTSNGEGIYITNSSTIQTTGIGTITLNGTGGAGVDYNSGVRLGTSSNISAVNGAISLTGVGGASTGIDNMGLYVHNGSAISATGTGSITLNGTGGSIGTAGGSNRGVRISSATVSSNSGTITINGTGAYDGDGVQVVAGAQVQSTIGAIAINGTSGDSSSSWAYGVWMGDIGTLVNSGGTLNITGISSATAGNNNIGTGVDTSAQIAATGLMTLTGTAGAGVSEGVRLTGTPAGSVVNAAGGLVISGTGNVLVGSLGSIISANSSANISATGDITFAGNLTTSAPLMMNTNAGAGTVYITGSGVVDSLINVNGHVDIALGGSLNADGTISGNLTNNGSLTPHHTGIAYGTLNTGNYSGTGTLNANIVNTANYDQLNVTGTANLASGSLNITSAGYIPTVGDLLNIVTAPTIGLFGTVTGVPAGMTNSIIGSSYALSMAGGAPCAYDICWTGADDGINWINALNWSTNTIPMMGQSVYIDVAGTPNILASGPITIGSLILHENLDYSDAAPYSLNIGSLVLNGGTLSGTGAINVGNSYSASGGSINRTGDMYISQTTGNTSFSATQVGNLSISASNGSVDLGSINASSIRASAASGTVTVNGQLTASTSGDAILIEAQKFMNTAGASALSTASGRWLVFAPNPGDVTKNGLTSNFRHYNGTEVDYMEFSNLYPATGNGFIYASAAGSLKVNTTLTGSASHVYGASPTASFGYTLSGFADSEDNDSNIGLGGGVTFTGTPTATSHAGPYTIGYGSGLSSTAGYTFGTGATQAYTVTQAPLTITGVVANDKEYDGNNSATLNNAGTLSGGVNGDTVAVGSYVATFADKNVNPVGTPKTVTVKDYTFTVSGTGLTSDYQLASTSATTTANITPKTITLGPVTAANKVYDGNTSATVSGTLNGVISSDKVALDITNASFEDKNAGQHKLVKSSNISLSGDDKGNYNFAVPSAVSAFADITRRPLTITGITGIDKAYDKLTFANVNIADDHLGSDSLMYTHNASFATADPGEKIPVSMSIIALSGGADQGNYQLVSLAQPLTTTASITGSKESTTETKQAVESTTNSINSNDPNKKNSEETKDTAKPGTPPTPTQVVIADAGTKGAPMTLEVAKGVKLVCK